MSLAPRTKLVDVDKSILSSYGPGGTDISIPRSQLKSLVSINVAKMAPDAAAGLLALHTAVLAAGGDFRVTDCFRSVDQQKAARQKYDNWIAAGKPAPGSPGWDAKTMKNAFVAVPGRSNHNAGRAIDVHLAALRFPGVAADKQLDKLWELAIPLGWSPIIREADERASEAWHFDFLGCWKPVQVRAGYESAAVAAAADVGNGETDSGWRRVQGQLHRAGYNVGTVDGLAGNKTKGALAASGFKGDLNSIASVVAYVDGLKDSATTIWNG
jgi:hypothetical protein